MQTSPRVIVKLVVVAVICVAVAATAFNLVDGWLDTSLGDIPSGIVATIASAIFGVAAVMASSQVLGLSIHDDDMRP